MGWYSSIVRDGRGVVRVLFSLAPTLNETRKAEQADIEMAQVEARLEREAISLSRGQIKQPVPSRRF